MKIPQYNDEARNIELVLASVERSSRVLDVGCGWGRNLDLLRRMGFYNLRGVDLNVSLVEHNRARGFDCVTVQELEKEAGQHQYDLIVMSHIVEHFSHEALLEFFGSYLGRLRRGGYLLIATPLPNSAFYNDFDHVRPYLPMGFVMVFGADPAQVQFQCKTMLKLSDLRFYRDQFRLQFFRGLYVAGANAVPVWANRFLKLLFYLSRGAIGRRIGWIALFRHEGERGAR